MTIEQAREQAAALYPERLVDTLGREHRSIARAAIMAGHWDNGAVVRRCLREGKDG